jgi:hypothetical protein
MREPKDFFLDSGSLAAESAPSPSYTQTVQDWIKSLAVRAVTITTDQGTFTVGPGSSIYQYTGPAQSGSPVSSGLVSILPWLGIGVLLVVLLGRR